MRHVCNVSLVGLGISWLASCNPAVSDTSPYDSLRTCTPENVVLLQEELSTFDGCERLDGSLTLRNELPDRSNLRSVVVITGNLGGGGYNGDPLTLDGLDSLEVVEGVVSFLEDNLGDFSGVPKLRSVGTFRVELVPMLEDFRGLESLREVHGTFRVTHNPTLHSLAGLEGLEHVHGDLTIRGNPELPAAEIDALLEHVKVDGEITVM
jgi:hypothetical protein